jgi:hypothetical protein
LGCLQLEKAVECGLTYLRATLAKPSWCLQEVEPAMKVLSCAPVWLLPKPARDELLAYLCYLGGLKAIFEGYYPVVSFLMEQARQLIRTNKIQFAVSLSLISLQELSFKQYADGA